MSLANTFSFSVIANMQRAIKKALEWNVLHYVGTFRSQEVHCYCRPFTVTNCFNSDNGAEVEGQIPGHP